MRVMNPVSLCENGFRLVAGADRGNIFIGKSPIPMLKPVVVPSLFRRVGIVFGFRANAKVCGVDARRVVTSVHNHHVSGNFADVKFIGMPMSAHRFFAGKQKDTVSVAVTGSFPFPTAICLIKTAFKHIVRAKKRVFRKAISGSCSRVAASAQLSRYSFWGITFNATELNNGLVSHLTPPVHQFYAITEV